MDHSSVPRSLILLGTVFLSTGLSIHLDTWKFYPNLIQLTSIISDLKLPINLSMTLLPCFDLSYVLHSVLVNDQCEFLVSSVQRCSLICVGEKSTGPQVLRKIGSCRMIKEIVYSVKTINLPIRATPSTGAQGTNPV